MAALDPLKQVISDIKRLLTNFLWGSFEGTSKKHWMSWDNICRAANTNGLGNTSLHYLNASFSGKLWWLYFTKDSLWTNLMRSKYGDPIHVISPRPSDSHT